MAEETAPTTGTEEPNGQIQDGKEFQAITSQEDFDKAIQARIARERAKFANYDEGQAAIARLAELEESQKTEAQKAQERLEAAEKRAAELELRSIRAEVAAAKGVPGDLLTGSTQEELEASADALIAFRGEKPGGPVIPTQGTTPGGAAKTTAELFAEAFGTD